MILVSILNHYATTECVAAMPYDNAVLLALPTVCGKPVHMAFDGG